MGHSHVVYRYFLSLSVSVHCGTNRWPGKVNILFPIYILFHLPSPILIVHCFLHKWPLVLGVRCTDRKSEFDKCLQIIILLSMSRLTVVYKAHTLLNVIWIGKTINLKHNVYTWVSCFYLTTAGAIMDIIIIWLTEKVELLITLNLD